MKQRVRDPNSANLLCCFAYCYVLCLGKETMDQLAFCLALDLPKDMVLAIHMGSTVFPIEDCS